MKKVELLNGGHLSPAMGESFELSRWRTTRLRDAHDSTTAFNSCCGDEALNGLASCLRGHEARRRRKLGPKEKDSWTEKI